MDPHDYQAFTDALRTTLERDPRVLGLMAAGSMAGISHQPDQWSDHDFWLIVEPGALAWYHAHFDWLPDSDQIVLRFRETQDGYKVVYRSGHLLEFAIFDRAGLRRAKVNDYRLLIDRDDLVTELEQMRRVTVAEFERAVHDDSYLLGQFLTNLLVGAGRYRRGEQLSARQFITASALHMLLRLIAKHVATDHPGALDNLDPLRRFETAYPALGAEINDLLRRDLVQTALGMLDLADRLLRDCVDGYPTEAVAGVRQQIQAE